MRRQKNKYIPYTINPSYDTLANLSQSIYESDAPYIQKKNEASTLGTALYQNMKNTVATHNLAYALENGTKHIDVLKRAQDVWLEGSYPIKDYADNTKENPKIYTHNLMGNYDDIEVNEISQDNMLYAQEILDDYNIPFAELYKFTTNHKNPNYNKVLVASLNESPDMLNKSYLKENEPYFNEYNELMEDKRFDNTYEMDVQKLKTYTPMESSIYTFAESKKRIHGLADHQRKLQQNNAIRANFMYEKGFENPKQNLIDDTNPKAESIYSAILSANIGKPDESRYLVYVANSPDKKHPQYTIAEGRFTKTDKGYEFETPKGSKIKLSENHIKNHLFPVKTPKDAERVIKSKIVLDTLSVQRQFKGDILKLQKEFGSESKDYKTPGYHNIKEATKLISKELITSLSKDNALDKDKMNDIERPKQKIMHDHDDIVDEDENEDELTL